MPEEDWSTSMEIFLDKRMRSGSTSERRYKLCRTLRPKARAAGAKIPLPWNFLRPAFNSEEATYSKKIHEHVHRNKSAGAMEEDPFDTVQNLEGQFYNEGPFEEPMSCSRHS